MAQSSGRRAKSKTKNPLLGGARGGFFKRRRAQSKEQDKKSPPWRGLGWVKVSGL